MWLNAKVGEIIEDVRGSYWFVPSLMALAGFAGGLALVYLDAVIGSEWLGRFEWFYGSHPEGARSLLSTVAGSTITVAGVVFSITLAAVTYASGQYGPRLLSNFTRDRGNQATLGVFIGTFLYCLVVLRTIRSGEGTGENATAVGQVAFVPQLAIFGALALAIGSIAMLIYFVHHVTDGIHINNVIARIGRQLLDDIAGETKRGSDDMQDFGLTAFPSASSIAANSTGYVEAIDEEGLAAYASNCGVTLEVLAIPGDFVHRGRPLLLVESGSSVEGLDACNDFFSIARKRSRLQDLRFLIDELVEIAARALSPGVTDPFTAIACIDWLGAALTELAGANPRTRTLLDDEGHPRVIVRRLLFVDYLDLAAGQLRSYAARDPNAAARLLHTLDLVEASALNCSDRVAVQAERARLCDAITRSKEY